MIYFMVVYVTIALFPLPSVRVRPKGQLISECPFGVLNFQKESTKYFLQISVEESKKWSNHKIKTLYTF